jgi:trimeric autotransporter adhesin
MHKMAGESGQGAESVTTRRSLRRRLAVVLTVCLSQAVVVWAATSAPVAWAAGITRVEIPAPAGAHPAGESFGEQVLVLSNGNYAIADPLAGNFIQGAVTLYDGVTNAAISTLVGGRLTGSGGMYEVGDSNFVVLSPEALNGGAVTWVDGTDGLNGAVTSANSITGYAITNLLDQTKIVALANGNYVIANPYWNGIASDGGFARWAPGNAPANGPIDATTSAVGLRAGDFIGSNGVVPLTNGNYVIASPEWDWPVFGSAFLNAGAATFGNGSTGLVGAISDQNSLIGVTNFSGVGSSVVALSNGNYVVGSPNWSDGGFDGMGAATWASGTAGVSGQITSTNSLVGQSLAENVGSAVTALTNGNYVVGTSRWDNGPTADVGAVTWANGATGKTGLVTAGDSIVGQLGEPISVATALTNGNYVVRSPNWGPTDVGAAMWVNGSGPATGVITAANSITGSGPNDHVGSASALSNGNYVVVTFGFAGGAGAITWASGGGPTSLVVSPANSIVGSTAGDLAELSVAPLDNGAYVVSSPTWDNGAVVDAGAARWASGTGPSAGAVTPANSLVGSTAGDRVGSNVAAVTGDRFVISSRGWTNEAVAGVGALTQADGGATVGPVSVQNSLVGVASGDALGETFQVGERLPVVFPNGTVAVYNPGFGASNIGAVAILGRNSTGPMSPLNSVIRSTIASTNFGTAASMQIGHKLTGSGAVLIGHRGEGSATLVYPATADYEPLAPARLADTRAGQPTVDGLFQAEGIRPAGSTYEITVAGRGGVPANAAAVALNVTATEATGPGFVTVYPCGSPRPTASSLNFTVGSTVPNAVIAKVGADRKVCFYVLTTTHLVVDVNGYFPATTAFHALNPARLLDTRHGEPTVDGVGAGTGLVNAGTFISTQVIGRGGVPADATAVVLNVTATEAQGSGFVTVYPCGSDVPLASNLNVTAGATVPNMVIAKIGTAGNVCVYTSTTTHLVIDVTGYFQADAWYHSLVPARLLETRPHLATVDGQQQGGGPAAAGSVTRVHVLGRGGVAADATTVVLNVTVTEAQASGYVTVYPCGIDPPLASNLNFTAGATIANAAIAKVGDGGDVCLFTLAATHLVVDVNGDSYS